MIPCPLDFGAHLFKTRPIVGNLAQTTGNQMAEPEGHMVVLRVEQVGAISRVQPLALLFERQVVWRAVYQVGVSQGMNGISWIPSESYDDVHDL